MTFTGKPLESIAHYITSSVCCVSDSTYHVRTTSIRDFRESENPTWGGRGNSISLSARGRRGPGGGGGFQSGLPAPTSPSHACSVGPVLSPLKGGEGLQGQLEAGR